MTEAAVAPPDGPDGVMLQHAAQLAHSLSQVTEVCELLRHWGKQIAVLLASGQRLLLAGNGGCDALADHFAAELVGRFATERPGLSALNLQSSTATSTALQNDYGFSGAVARAVQAHGRPGDLLLCLSTSGNSANLLAAIRCANEYGLSSWALTGRVGSPMAVIAHEAISFEGASGATVQEMQLLALHMVSIAIDIELARADGSE